MKEMPLPNEVVSNNIHLIGQELMIKGNKIINTEMMLMRYSPCRAATKLLAIEWLAENPNVKMTIPMILSISAGKRVKNAPQIVGINDSFKINILPYWFAYLPI